MKIWKRYQDVVAATWHLGVTAFGGPAVQYQTFHRIFVEEKAWIDEAMYQQIFAICQALPGSASVKMLYCINAVHGGLGAGFIAMVFFCIPGAIGMYGLSVGIAQVGETLPRPVYALLSGLNAATVGLIALAAVNLEGRAVTDSLTRILVFLGGVLGMLYTALWYYPAIMAAAGVTTMIWDLGWPHTILRPVIRRWARARSSRKSKASDVESCRDSWPAASAPDDQQTCSAPVALSKFAIMPRHSLHSSTSTAPATTSTTSEDSSEPTPAPPSTFPTLLPLRLGSILLIFFLGSFLAIILLRTLLPPPLPRPLALFSSLYLAGTIIFGGGPVVIPLLREYIVSPGWVSPRDFLLGLAVIQAFPGPNFNFAVYLGALAAKSVPGFPAFAGAAVAFVAIFTPGLLVMLGFLGLWAKLQARRWFVAVLRGVNAAAVGLVFTAVYKLWEIGLVGGGGAREGDVITGGGGMPLGGDAWLVAITAGAFVGGKWYGMSAPTAILCGGVAGIVRWAIFER
ncbi:MAG: hypothetical protein LQ344_006758 [Seirophora lacunosa]|nr:MAG: hypothetical protein LQ344_006758 [Seirophora lacunosa]